jgi:para-aminobenzoate synthetase / 4-amino-4-deoxychorismate lyase
VCHCVLCIVVAERALEPCPLFECLARATAYSVSVAVDPMQESPVQVPAPPFLLFHFAGREGETTPLLFSAPVAVVTAHRPEHVRPALRAVERARTEGLYAAGYVGYEAAPAFDPALVVRHGGAMPLLWFGLFDAPVSADVSDGPAGTCPSAPGEWAPSRSRSSYDAAIAHIRSLIERGETYQVNYTLRFRARLPGYTGCASGDLALYRRLRGAQNGGYGAYLHLGRFRVLSVSPELFFRTDGDTITTRPMKGTARRGRWTEEDAAAAARLLHSEKDRAENLMIVDLVRNDLGRIARTGSVRVPRLLEVERYRTVLQMTSTVTASIAPDAALEEIFAALFPCGSVTGAPKVTAMRAIAALEDAPREVYCGAIGFAAPDRSATFSVAIRTMGIDGHTGAATYGAGGGITWDSTAAGEYDEVLAKVAPLHAEWPSFDLLETLRLEHGRYVRLDRHLGRLGLSARYFGFSLSEPAVAGALAAHARRHAQGRRRVRLLVSERGEARVESVPLPERPGGDGGGQEAPQPVALAGSPVSSRDPFLCHKTTNRATYETHLAREAAGRPGLFDVLLWNQEALGTTAGWPRS